MGLSWRGRLLRPEMAWSIALAVLTASIAIFLAANHAFVSMWIEGMAAYVSTLLRLAGFTTTAPGLWLNVAGVSLPLALAPYIGPAFFFYHLPSAYLWFIGLTTDPYFYRYEGIVFFMVDAWIFYYLLRRAFSPAVSFYTAAAFLTMPVPLFACLTDYDTLPFMIFPFLLAFLFLSNYFRNHKQRHLLLASFLAGLTLTTRVEGFVWTASAAIFYLACTRPRALAQHWRATPHKARTVAFTVGTFLVGAAPLIIVTVVFPRDSVFSFATRTILPNSFHSGSLPLTATLLVRFAEFVRYNLLGIWPMFQLSAPNLLFTLFWFVCVLSVVICSASRRTVPYSLSFLCISLVLSIFTTGGPRNEHLSVLQPVQLLVFASGSACLSRTRVGGRLLAFVLPLVIAGNVMTSSLDWAGWKGQSADSQSMLNQSDPVLLASYLLRYHLNDRLVFTNIGLEQYVEYAAVGRLKGENILNWYSIDDFSNAVRWVLYDGSRRRVLVAVSLQHDGRAGTLPRTARMYAVLHESGIAYKVEHLGNSRNRFLYDLVVIERGVVPKALVAAKGTLYLDAVVDVRINKEKLIGSIIGSGFQPFDMVRVDGERLFPTAFGNDRWLTFAIARGSLPATPSLEVRVFRPKTGEVSAPVQVTMPR